MTTTTRARRQRRMNRAEEPVRAVIYVRLSRAKTGDSRADADRNTEVGLDTQRAGCERVIAARGGTVVAVMQDVQSGDRLDRPGLWEAIARIKSGDANTLIVYALDRLGRDQVQQGVVIHELRRAGGTLLSATEDLADRSAWRLHALGGNLRGGGRTGEDPGADESRVRCQVQDRARYKPSTARPMGTGRSASERRRRTRSIPAEAAIVTAHFRGTGGGNIVAAHRRGTQRAMASRPRPDVAQWGQSTLDRILDRPVYATGEHECWRTTTVRDADGIPMIEDRPREDRYTVAFPPIIDPASSIAPASRRNGTSGVRDEMTAPASSASAAMGSSAAPDVDGRSRVSCAAPRRADLATSAVGITTRRVMLVPRHRLACTCSINRSGGGSSR